MSKLEKALEEALRWKTALDAANKGARRKSRQARLWRERAEDAEEENVSIRHSMLVLEKQAGDPFPLVTKMEKALEAEVSV